MTTAVVIGGTSGIGLAAARQFAARGVSTHVVGRNPQRLEAVNGAIEAMVRPLAVELAPVRVNAVSPGLVDTPWWDAVPRDAREAYFAQAEKTLPVRRVATADDVAEAVVFVASNPNVSGTVIESDGGARLVSLA